MIAGIRGSKLEKQIFKHNDMEDLEAKLRKLDHGRAKIIAFESVYSMSGKVLFKFSHEVEFQFSTRLS